MKVAVLGSSPAAQSITRELLALGASVRLFWPEVLTHPELQKWRDSDVLIQAPWQQVTKRFLLPGQKPQDKSRFADLFRVSYFINPEPLIERSKDDSPEVYQKLTEEFMASLKRQLEMFEDVDVVIDASPAVSRRELGPGGPAIGETRLRADTIRYGQEFSDSAWLSDATEVALVGDGREAAESLIKLKSWLGDKKNRLFHITSTARPFEALMQEGSTLAAPLKDFLTSAELEQAEALKEYEARLAEWMELDGFIKAKKPKPEEPIPRYVVFSGHLVTSVDQLIDKTRSFLTLETSPFVRGEVQSANNEVELKTIGVDKIIAATGTRRAWEKFHGMDLSVSADQKDARDPAGLHPEVGFFTLGDKLSPKREAQILFELQKLFSPRTP